MRSLFYIEFKSVEAARLWAGVIKSYFVDFAKKTNGKLLVSGYFGNKPAMAVAVRTAIPDATEVIVHYLRYFEVYIIAYAYDRSRVFVSKLARAVEMKTDCPAIGDARIVRKVVPSRHVEFYTFLNDASRI